METETKVTNPVGGGEKASPIKKEVKFEELLKEKRRESVNLVLSKINLRVDTELREAMEKEEEEWENIKRGIHVEEGDSEYSSGSD